MCSLRDAATDLGEIDTRILAASLDDVQAQKAFVEAQGLPYPVLSDPDGGVAAKYGVLAGDGRFAARVTFVVDPQGVVRYVDRAVDVTAHGADLLRIVKDLRAAAAGD